MLIQSIHQKWKALLIQKIKKIKNIIFLNKKAFSMIINSIELAENLSFEFAISLINV